MAENGTIAGRLKQESLIYISFIFHSKLTPLLGYVYVYLRAAATVPASSVVSPGLPSPACTRLCLTMWGSAAAGDHSSKQ